MNNERKYKAILKKKKIMISDADDRFNTRVYKIVRDFTEAFFFFFLQRFLTHHGPRDRQKRK